MNWKRIPKESTPLPNHGSAYSDWKVELAEEGFHQCVYCSISENSFGGIRNFHVEHYRPKGLVDFAHLKNDFLNLFYACAICNTFKSDDWIPPKEDCSIGCYPDPSKKSYGELFSINHENGLLSGNNVAGAYILNKLYLNRPQLIINRKESIAEQTYNRLIQKVNVQKDDLFTLVREGNQEALSLLKELDFAVRELEATFHHKESTNPYTSEQTKKPG